METLFKKCIFYLFFKVRNINKFMDNMLSNLELVNVNGLLNYKLEVEIDIKKTDQGELL
jgi:hypothetical protein